jgi:hypothetical protein
MKWYKFWLSFLATVYGGGFLLVLFLHIALLGNVTPTLALSRAALWPIWLVTGHPHGVVMTIDCPINEC